MLKLTVKELIAELKKHIACDKELMIELIHAFVPFNKYEVSEECLKDPRRIIGRLLNILIWEIDGDTMDTPNRDALIGYVYLVRAKIGFAEKDNEQKAVSEC